jgi:hypothetical protein
LDEQGKIVVVEEQDLGGWETKVWPLEKLLPHGKLVGVRGQGLEEGDSRLGELDSALEPRVRSWPPVAADAECEGRVLIEFKGQTVPFLDILKWVVGLDRVWVAYGVPVQGSGIARNLFSKAFAMAEAIRAGP